MTTRNLAGHRAVAAPLTRRRRWPHLKRAGWIVLVILCASPLLAAVLWGAVHLDWQANMIVAP